MVRLTTRWSRPGQPGVWLSCDTSLGLAGRLISRPLGSPWIVPQERGPQWPHSSTSNRLVNIERGCKTWKPSICSEPGRLAPRTNGRLRDWKPSAAFSAIDLDPSRLAPRWDLLSRPHRPTLTTITMRSSGGRSASNPFHGCCLPLRYCPCYHSSLEFSASFPTFYLAKATSASTSAYPCSSQSPQPLCLSAFSCYSVQDHKRCCSCSRSRTTQGALLQRPCLTPHLFRPFIRAA